MRYLPLRAVEVTSHAIPDRSSDRTVYAVSRLCRSVNDLPSVTTNCIVSTFVLSIVGLYTSDSTPPATVYQTFEVRPIAVPRQSLRASPKWDSAPGPPGAPSAGAASAAAAGTTSIGATSA